MYLVDIITTILLFNLYTNNSIQEYIKSLLFLNIINIIIVLSISILVTYNTHKYKNLTWIDSYKLVFCLFSIYLILIHILYFNSKYFVS